ncbi:MipA/OmpV family protein [Colwellia sp. D2M02]|uniref:MipA/OmpV family protein n=1 Tax=Colwellia asteriadis TaxID=517723 RepID=A0ABP3WE00_9GAMM|nr:MipA/OmpV family protein [Colwellia sp. D2M02]MBU2894200.1 MipA/OmpV family protein [Colwellia sp. D2M02]
MSNTAFASDTNTAVNPNAPIVKDSFEWQLIVDFSAFYQQSTLQDVKQTDFVHFIQPALYIDLSYKGFFLQSNQRRSSAVLEGAEFGYQITVQDNWQLDILAKSYLNGFDPNDLVEYLNANPVLFSGLRERDSTGGVALRYSHFFENAIFSLDIAAAHSGDDAFGEDVTGVIIDSFYSYLLPYRNWDIYLGAGLTYYQDNIVNYYYGIQSVEATPQRPEFTADSAVRAQLEIYAQYPLSASWSFNGGVTQSIYSPSIKDSPLVDRNFITQVMVGVQYVF